MSDVSLARVREAIEAAAIVYGGSRLDSPMTFRDWGELGRLVVDMLAGETPARTPPDAPHWPVVGQMYIWDMLNPLSVRGVTVERLSRPVAGPWYVHYYWHGTNGGIGSRAATLSEFSEHTAAYRAATEKGAGK